MNKVELTKSVATRTGVTQKDAAVYVDAVIEVCNYYSVPCLDLFRSGGIQTDIAAIKEIYSKATGNKGRGNITKKVMKELQIDDNIAKINEMIASTIQTFINTEITPTAVPPIPFIELNIGKLNTTFNIICKI